MILLLDIGSSRIKWASLEQGDLHYGGSAAHQKVAFQDLARSLWSDIAQPSRVVAANVAGRAFSEILGGWIKDTWGLDAEFVAAQRQAYGMTNAYVEPRQLGADRWAALVAARHSHSGPVSVVDCGTAITIDALSADGRHLGGLIVPGLNLMRRALIENTQGIADALEIDIKSRAALLARDTQGGITAGTLYAVVALIDRVVADMAAELKTELPCLITGGDAPSILPLLTGRYQYEQHLVLRGLAIIAQQGG